MTRPTVETLAARLDVQAVVLQELARALLPEQAVAVAAAVRRRVVELAARDLPHAVDVVVASELTQLLDAFTRR